MKSFLKTQLKQIGFYSKIFQELLKSPFCLEWHGFLPGLISSDVEATV